VPARDKDAQKDAVRFGPIPKHQLRFLGGGKVGVADAIAPPKQVLELPKAAQELREHVVREPREDDDAKLLDRGWQ
jgi:ribosomal protein S15P/S13E